MIPKSWTIKELLTVTTSYLKKKQIENPRLTSEILLAHQLNRDRVGLYLNFDQPLAGKELSGYRSLIRRRLLREPLQYITGVQEFWSLALRVSPQVLIPRPETELLVEQAAVRVKAIIEEENRTPMILDIGTGCGAVAIALAEEFKEVCVWATDISAGALGMARLNAEEHGVSDRIRFVEGDLLKPLFNQGMTFHIVLSNPPYVTSEEYNDLPPEVRDYEPRLALDGHEGGMYHIEKIIRGGPEFIRPGGWLLLEMAPHQTEKALSLMEEVGEYAERTRIRDYSNHYRVVMALRAGRESSFTNISEDPL